MNNSEYTIVEDACSDVGCFNGPQFHVLLRGEYVHSTDSVDNAKEYVKRNEQ